MILVLVVAAGIGLYFLIADLTEDDAPEPTVPEFTARMLAKSAYYESDNTVADAVCDALHYRSADDTWEIECGIDREDEREITLWEVAPDRSTTQTEIRFEPLAGA